MAKTISLAFSGYWLIDATQGVPPQSGVYAFYRSIPNNEGTYFVSDLLYIGESLNIQERIETHRINGKCKNHLRNNERLCFSYATVSTIDRQRAEAAMINYHKPVENTEYSGNFPFEDTTMILSGDTAKMSTIFTVTRS